MLIFLIVITIGNKAYSQLDVSSEVGVVFGVTSFQTDFGIRHDFPSANAQTMGYGVVHYLKFFGKQYSWRSGSSFFSEHFMLKTEFLYLNNTNQFRVSLIAIELINFKSWNITIHLSGVKLINSNLSNILIQNKEGIRIEGSGYEVYIQNVSFQNITLINSSFVLNGTGVLENSMFKDMMSNDDIKAILVNDDVSITIIA